MDDIVKVSDSIVASLRAALEAAGCALIEGEIPDGSDVQRVGGQLRPTAAFFLSTPRSGARGSVGITGLKNAMSTLTGSVICIAETYTSCRNLMLLVSGVLNGLQPGFGASEVECLGSAQAGPTKDILRPVRYVQTVGFALSVGAKSVVS